MLVNAVYMLSDIKKYCAERNMLFIKPEWISTGDMCDFWVFDNNNYCMELFTDNTALVYAKSGMVQVFTYYNKYEAYEHFIELSHV